MKQTRMSITVHCALAMVLLTLASCKQYSVKVKGDTKHTVETTTMGRVDVVQSGESKTVIEYRIDVSLCAEIKRAVDAVNPDDATAGPAAESKCLTTLIEILGAAK